MNVRRIAALLAMLVLVTGCTGGGRSQPPRTAGPTGARTSPAPSPIVIDVVATVSPEPFTGPVPNPYVEGMQLAEDIVNRSGGIDGHPIELSIHDPDGDVETATRRLQSLAATATAMMYVGPATGLLPLRPRLEQTGTPVVLLEGDLYTSRGLFREVFQTTIPWAWQATVIARYLVVDRKAADIVFVGTGPEARAAADSARAAVEYWGGRLGASFANSDPDPVLRKVYLRAARADAVILFGAPFDALEDVNAIEEVARPLPSISGSASLLVRSSEVAHPDPGATACYTYTWAGWAKPIERVARFRSLFNKRFGRLPSGLEQEGYDAVRVLAEGLKATGGEGGRLLIAALERLRTQTFSSFPVDLGPDDHVFLPRDELGLFAVPGPGERLDRWQIESGRNWRPVMRTFTYDGKRTNILDRDKRVFFPFWRKNRPPPYYWQSRYGITSRKGDQLH